MQLLFIVDLHGASRELDRLPAADVLLVGGDLTQFGTTALVVAMAEGLAARYPRLVTVAGNCDAADADAALARQGSGIHLVCRDFGAFRVVGIGGCNRTPFGTPNEWDEDAMARSLALLADEIAGQDTPVVLVTHAPPLGSGADRLPNGAQVGSRAVAEFARRIRPVAVLCGHIHEAVGTFDWEGIPVANPGPIARGGFVILAAPGLKPVLGKLAAATE